MKKEERKKMLTITLEELYKRLTTEQKNALRLKLQKQAGKLKDLHEYAKKRKQIAWIKTQIRHKELESR